VAWFESHCAQGNTNDLSQEDLYNDLVQEVHGGKRLPSLYLVGAHVNKGLENLNTFLERLNKGEFVARFHKTESPNYASIFVLEDPGFGETSRIDEQLWAAGIEYRRGPSGGNQLCQPDHSEVAKDYNLADFANLEHVHHFGWYIGIYPEAPPRTINELSASLSVKRKLIANAQFLLTESLHPIYRISSSKCQD